MALNGVKQPDLFNHIQSSNYGGKWEAFEFYNQGIVSNIYKHTCKTIVTLLCFYNCLF